MEKLWKKEAQKKFLKRSDLSKLVREVRKSGKTLVTLNGSFDLLHAGHLQIIYEASLQADVFIICLNTDASIQSYKGKNRPIIPLEERMQMVAALAFVDYVTAFSEPTPDEVLHQVQPDVHVNGAEYGKDCIESATVRLYGGRLHIVDIVGELSTTNILERIKQCG